MSPAPRQHTPGPWTVDNQYIHGPDGIRFLAVAGDGAGQANALLIASAPELLAALEAAAELAEGTVKLLRQLDMESGRIAAECVLRDARAAIAKATGGAA